MTPPISAHNEKLVKAIGDPGRQHQHQSDASGALRKATIGPTAGAPGGERSRAPARPNRPISVCDSANGGALSGSTIAVHNVANVAKISSARMARTRRIGSLEKEDEHRPQQVRIRERAAFSILMRKDPKQESGHRQGQTCGDEIDGTPAAKIGQPTGGEASHQNAEHGRRSSPCRRLSHAPPVRPNLRQRRRGPARRRRAGRQQPCLPAGQRRRRETDGDEGQHRQQALSDDEAAAVEQIAQRHDKDEPERIADLSDGYDDADRRRSNRKFRAPSRRARVSRVDIGNAQPTSDGKEQGRLPRQSGRRKCFRGDRSHVLLVLRRGCIPGQ